MDHLNAAVMSLFCLTELCVLCHVFRALTLSSLEVRFHIDSETHDPIDLQTKELMWVITSKQATFYIYLT